MCLNGVLLCVNPTCDAVPRNKMWHYKIDALPYYAAPHPTPRGLPQADFGSDKPLFEHDIVHFKNTKSPFAQAAERGCNAVLYRTPFRFTVAQVSATSQYSDIQCFVPSPSPLPHCELCLSAHAVAVVTSNLCVGSSSLCSTSQNGVIQLSAPPTVP